jgi:hypothetical protein
MRKEALILNERSGSSSLVSKMLQRLLSPVMLVIGIFELALDNEKGNGSFVVE